MMQDLYQQLILDHNNNPRNFRVQEQCSVCKEGFNPLCGDEITVYLDIQTGMIKDISFQGQGCAICIASGSLMTENVMQLTVQEALDLAAKVQTALTQDKQVDLSTKLQVLQGVKQYPMRVKCASLAWHALKDALLTWQKNAK